LILKCRIGYAPVPQDVVHRDYSPGSEQPQQELVIGVISRLVRIYESKIECTLQAILRAHGRLQ
jgi:hypothetical protein